MVKEQITNTGVIPAMTSADDGYSSQEGPAMEKPALPTGADRVKRD
jgi:hypothetical protein